jgi:hypothetical protein
MFNANNNQITTTRTIQAWCKGHNATWIDDFSNGGGGNRPADLSTPSYENDFSIYPNPASDKVNIIIPPLGEEYIDILITDINGRSIQKEHYNLVADDYNQVSVSFNKNITSGVYLVHLSASNYRITRKLIIQ